MDTPISPDAIRRFTTEYVVPEDRIRISLERGDDRVVILWLTRRLMSRLVPELVKIVDALPRQGQPTQAQPPSDNAQRRNQLDALGKLEQQAPVLAGPAPDTVESHLITGLGVRMARGGTLIDFKAGEETIQTIPFPEEALRQWLGMLHMNFTKAAWAEDIWPAWITAKGWDQGPDALRLN
jgi:hypothetical protein